MAENNNRDDDKKHNGPRERGVHHWAKTMDVKEEKLRDAMKKYGVDETDLKNVHKRNLLAQAIDQSWTRDQYKGAYDMNISDEADFDWEQIVTKFGYSLGVVKEFQKELKPIFKWLADQLQKGESVENLIPAFNRKLDKTKFGQRTPEEIEADKARYGSERKDFKDVLKSLSQRIKEVAGQKYGQEIVDRMIAEGKVREIAMELIYQEEGFLTGSFDDALISREMRPFVSKYLDAPDEQDATEGGVGGEIGAYKTELMRWLSSNGVVMNADRVNKYLQDIERGITDVEQVKQDIRNKDFTRQYQAYANLFKEGQDVADVAMDFRQSAAELLEKPLDSISIKDPLVQQALGYKNKDGQPSPMALYEFEQQVRASPEWDKTDNAMRTYTDIGESILRAFGFRG